MQETQQLGKELNEERSRYQNLLSEHLRLEEKYDDLKEHLASSVSDVLDHQTAQEFHFPCLSKDLPHLQNVTRSLVKWLEALIPRGNYSSV